jgi:hypothetical protein
MSKRASKVGVVVGIVILAAICVYVMYLLKWTVRGSDTAQGLLGLDICLWVIFWTLCLTGYWGLPANKLPVVRKHLQSHHSRNRGRHGERDGLGSLPADVADVHRLEPRLPDDGAVGGILLLEDLGHRTPATLPYQEGVQREH